MSRWCRAVSLLVLLTARSASAQSTSASSPPPIRWPVVAAATGLVVTASLLDATIAHDIQEHPSVDRLSTANDLARFGTVAIIGPTVGALAIVGLVAHQRALTHAALETTASVAAATIVVQALKLIVGRERPYNDPDRAGDDFALFSGKASFPSGHTTVAFAFATALGDAIHRPWARVGLYALATGTAWARVAQEAHWTSDVVAGAALGVASAKFATGRRAIFGLRAPRLGISSHRLTVSWDGLPWQPTISH